MEAKSAAGLPLRVKGVLLNNDKVVDTIETNTYGCGKFQLTPYKGNRYRFRMLHPDALSHAPDTSYLLPPVAAEGPAISLAKALIEDTLHLTVNLKAARKLLMLIHNYHEVLEFGEFAGKRGSNHIAVPLAYAPRGVATVTLLDTMGHPLAERLFFVHYHEKFSLPIKADQPTYLTKHKVNISLTLSGDDSRQFPGIASVACAQDNRFEFLNKKDITSYVYLEQLLQQLPPDPGGEEMHNQEYMSYLLLIKGWRRYNWADMAKVTAKDTLLVNSAPQLSATVTRAGKPAKTNLSLALMKGAGGVQFLPIMNNGIARLPEQYLKTNDEKALTLMVADKVPERYNIDLNDPFFKINNKVAGLLSADSLSNPKAAASNEQEIHSLENIIQLKEVVIKDSRSDEFHGAAAHSGPGHCEDYVCHGGILNCPAHWGALDNTTPVIGQIYEVGSDHNVKYKGCILFVKGEIRENYRLALKGISYAKEVYSINPELLDTQMPVYNSTLYWNPQIKLEPNRQVNLSFYTGDITGKFRVVVQGVQGNEVISGETFFNVKKP